MTWRISVTNMIFNAHAIATMVSGSAFGEFWSAITGVYAGTLIAFLVSWTIAVKTTFIFLAFNVWITRSLRNTRAFCPVIADRAFSIGATLL